MRVESSAEMLAQLKQRILGRQAKPVVVNRLRDLKDNNGIRDMPMIDPRILVIEDGHNPRDYSLPENRAHLDEFKLSIKANGVIEPLLVRWDAGTKSAIVVDGECRLRATLELIAEGCEIAAVPVIQVQGGNEADRLLTAITANTGKPLSKWELGTAFQRLYKFGWSEEQIATKTGYRASFITEAMELADAPIEVKKMLSERAVTPSLALEELRVNGSAAVESLRKKATERKASGKTGPAARPKAANPKPQPAPPSPTLVSVVRELLDDVAVTDLSDDSKPRIAVDRMLLLKLASFAVNESQPAQAVTA